MINFKECEGVIFDLDGTLVDSMWVWEQIDQDFLGKRGFAVPEDYLEKITPMGFEACADYTIERFGLKETRLQVMEEWYLMAVDSYTNKVPLKKGVREFLEYLKSYQVKMSIATASDMSLVLPVLRNNEIQHYFDNITTLKEVKRGKGFPDIYHLAAEKMQVHNNSCVVFEDSVNGLHSGLDAKMKVVGLLTTNPVDVVAPLSDVQVKDYVGMTYDTLSQSLHFTIDS